MNTTKTKGYTIKCIKDYITECINEEYLNECGYTEDLQGVYNCFMSEVGNTDIKLGWSERKSFGRWLMGLCSALQVDYETHQQKAILDDWGILFTSENVNDVFCDSIYEVFKDMLAEHNKSVNV